MTRTSVTFLKTAVRIAKESPQERISRMRRCVTTSELKTLAHCLGLSTTAAQRLLGMGGARRRASSVGQAPPLSLGDAERVVGLWQLIGQVQSLAKLNASGYNLAAVRKLGSWLVSSDSVLGKTPAYFVDTFEGRSLLVGHLQTMHGNANFNDL